MFFLGAALGSAVRFGIGTSNIFTEFGAQLGASIEVILLSIALASKINAERKSRYEAQKKSLTLALEKPHPNEQMSKVFYPHHIAMIQDGRLIEQTMPRGLEAACVLSFNVISSSKIDNEAFSELIEDFIAEWSLIKAILDPSSHQRFKGRRGCIVGQGELKVGGFDPLFSLNHTYAMISQFLSFTQFRLPNENRWQPDLENDVAL